MISDAPSANGVISLSHTFGLYGLTYPLNRGCQARGPNVIFYTSSNFFARDAHTT